MLKRANQTDQILPACKEKNKGKVSNVCAASFKVKYVIDFPRNQRS
jgi:hypothetical protein